MCFIILIVVIPNPAVFAEADIDIEFKNMNSPVVLYHIYSFNI